MSQEKARIIQYDQNPQVLNLETIINNQPKICSLKQQQQKMNEKSNQITPNNKYLNNLFQSISKRDWTQEQDQLVYNLHNQLGNKWALIAERLSGRTDNCVKNHFYSRLRKGLRKLNKKIEDQFKKTKFKQFKTIDLYKVIEASDQKFKEVKSFTNQMTELGLELKNRLFKFAEEQDEDSQEYKQNLLKLIEDMSQFSKNYKRKSKKNRRYSPMGVDSVYRQHCKKNLQHTDLGQQQIQVIKQENVSESQKRNNENEIKLANFQEKDQIQKKLKLEKDSSIKTIQKDIGGVVTKQCLIQAGNIQNKIARKNSKDFHHFSDQDGQQKHELEYLKQQKLNHFAENILKTFKSYYSFKSFKSNIDDPFFE